MFCDLNGATLYPSCLKIRHKPATRKVQMACAYVGSCIMPPIFGLIAAHISLALLPVYLFGVLALMVVMHEKLVRKLSHK